MRFTASLILITLTFGTISGGLETPTEAFLRALDPEVLVIIPALPKFPPKNNGGN
jgi:hypothetical protein